ncbi:hypothetical protein, partial [Proteus genomosp. 6]|uniref:hypothetical protein n=1 Tax=Proteus genomosp. 6 TaxID=1311820 RepID=UPI0032DB5248
CIGAGESRGDYALACFIFRILRRPLLVSVVIVDGLPKLAVMDGFQRYCALMEIVAEGGQIEGVDVKEA